MGDAGREFQDCMGDTELAHLLEHLTVEIMNATGLAGAISCGRTHAVAEDPRLFDIELSCPDDALTIGALSSASFMMEWAFLHPEATAPDYAGTVEGLRQLVLGLRGEDEGSVEKDAAESDASAEDVSLASDDDDPVASADGEAVVEPVFGGAAAVNRG